MQDGDEADRIRRYRRRKGPWDASEVPDRLREPGRLDLGGLVVLVPDRTRVSLRVDEHIPVAVSLGLHGSSLELQVFRIVRCSKGWDDFRMGLLDRFRWAKSAVGLVKGPHGDELIVGARVGEDSPMRFLGCDGPGWVLTGGISGVAAMDREWAAEFEQIFRDTIVVPSAGADADIGCCEPIPLRDPRLLN